MKKNNGCIAVLDMLIYDNHQVDVSLAKFPQKYTHALMFNLERSKLLHM